MSLLRAFEADKLEAMSTPRLATPTWSRAFVLVAIAVVLVVSGCASILGADFDRAADRSTDGGAAGVELVTQIPPAELPGPGGTCAAERKLCEGSCISHFEPNVGCGAATCEPCSRAQAVAACTAGGRCAIASCESGWADCNGNATDGCESELVNDPKNCGACGRPCGAGLVCAQGACVSVCPEGTRSCDGACKAESVTSCGASCAPCTAPPYGVATCAAAGCEFTCRSGYAPSGAGCIDAMASDTWMQLANMPTPRGSLAVVATGGRIYAIGGASSTAVLSTLEVYDPATDVWTKLPNMPTPRFGLTAAVGADGRIYAIGGRGAGGSTDVRSTVEAFTPATNTWTNVANMPMARGGLAAVTGQDGRIYAMGGGNAMNAPLSTVEVYTPNTNTWAGVANMPSARGSFGAAIGADGRIYAIGGGGFAVTSPSVDVYTPNTNAWASAANMPTFRQVHAAAVDTNHRIYAVGGERIDENADYSSAMEMYDSSTNTWKSLAPLPTARKFLAAVGVEGRIYVIGGERQGKQIVSTVEVYKP